MQRSAERIGGFTIEPLQARRDAAAVSLALKMLDGKVQGELKCFTPVLSEPLRLCKKRTRNSLEGIQVVSKVRARSLDVYKRSFLGALPKIWSRLPMDLIRRGERYGWLKIKTACSDFLTGKKTTEKHKKQKTSEILPEICSAELNNELNGNV